MAGDGGVGVMVERYLEIEVVARIRRLHPPTAQEEIIDNQDARILTSRLRQRMEAIEREWDAAQKEMDQPMEPKQQWAKPLVP